MRFSSLNTPKNLIELIRFIYFCLMTNDGNLNLILSNSENLWNNVYLA